MGNCKIDELIDNNMGILSMVIFMKNLNSHDIFIIKWKIQYVIIWNKLCAISRGIK